MDNRSIFALFVIILLICAYIALCFSISVTPQELSGYDLQLEDLYEGESYCVAALSPSVESAEYEITSATSDYVFLFTGNPEIVSLPSDEGFAYKGQATLGCWDVIEGRNVDVSFHSETALKVTADRGFDYHAIVYYFLAIITLILCGLLTYIITNS